MDYALHQDKVNKHSWLQYFDIVFTGRFGDVYFTSLLQVTHIFCLYLFRKIFACSRSFFSEESHVELFDVEIETGKISNPKEYQVNKVILNNHQDGSILLCV